MGLVTEIRRKISEKSNLPPLEINSAQKEQLKCGETLIIDDSETGESYIIRLNIDKIGFNDISEKDLEIDSIKTPKV
jgi:hypothetical protein